MARRRFCLAVGETKRSGRAAEVVGQYLPADRRRGPRGAFDPLAKPAGDSDRRRHLGRRYRLRPRIDEAVGMLRRAAQRHGTLDARRAEGAASSRVYRSMQSY